MMQNSIKTKAQIPESILRGVIYLVVLVIALAIPFYKFLIYPVNILVSAEAGCEGTIIYVDGIETPAGKALRLKVE